MINATIDTFSVTNTAMGLNPMTSFIVLDAVMTFKVYLSGTNRQGYYRITQVTKVRVIT